MSLVDAYCRMNENKYVIRNHCLIQFRTHFNDALFLKKGGL